MERQKHLVSSLRSVQILLCIVLATVTASIYFYSSPMQAATTKATANIQLGQVSWANIWKFLGRKKRGGGSRGDGVCAIAPFPSQPPMQIWNLQPLFFWQGEVRKIEVHQHNSGNSLFSTDVNYPNSSVLYQGKALQPGTTYDLKIFNSRNYPLYRIPFQIMPAPEREKLATDLENLKARLKARKANNEMIALHLANYFAKHELWADVVQSALSVENPSDELKDFLQNLPDICIAPQGSLEKTQPSSTLNA